MRQNRGLIKNAGAHRTHPVARAVQCLASAGAALFAPCVLAFPIDTGESGVAVSLDTQVRYSTAWRLKKQSPGLIEGGASVNQDDGDRNFNRGLISNRLDLFSEFGASYKEFGLRLSGAAWYDDVYNHSNDNDSPSTANSLAAPYNEFNDAAKKLHGRKAEMLDAFVYGRSELGSGSSASFRLGRHAVLWGESLFFGGNGIAGTQAAVDVVKLLSVPNSLFKEITRPDNQISGLLQINPELALGAYYKFDWEKNRIPAAGSYFSPGEVAYGGERLITSVGPPTLFFRRDADQNAKDSGQGGVEVKWAPPNWDVDLGFYAVRYHDRNPQTYVYPGLNAGAIPGQIGSYHLVYAQDIKAFGVSASSTFGPVNLAAEMSTRRNAALVSDPQLVFGGAADNSDNPRYAVGNTFHAQISWIWALSPSFISREASFSGEVAGNRRLSVSRNPNAIAANSARDALGLRGIYSPTYRQVISGVDISVPIGIGYSPRGNSSAVAAFGTHKGGDINVGITGSYLDVWRFSLTATHFYGPEGTFLDTAGHLTFKQSAKDRDFVALAFNRTF